MNKIINEIVSIYKSGNYSYLLSKYIKKDYWDEMINKFFPQKYFENMTDLNYGKCFTFQIDLSNIKVNVGTIQFKQCLKESNLYRLEIQISLLAPYMMFKFFRYYLDGNEVKIDSDKLPFIEEHLIYLENLKEFIANNDLIALDDDILMTEVPDVSLELRTQLVSVYNCLFEDSVSYYPYN